MNKIEEAIRIAKKIAEDSSHGYDQTNRWGPDYDCSSFLITVWERAGVPVKTNGATYTGNMLPAFLSSGFVAVYGEVQPGDVFLNIQNHTAMCVAHGQIIQARSNESGGITGGQTGDQTGREIGIVPYYDYPWDFVLRYMGEDTPEEEPTQSGTYTVKSGDTLWGIAEAVYGDGSRYTELMERNGLTSFIIYPGTVLQIGKVEEPQTDTVELTVVVKQSTFDSLTRLAVGYGKPIGEIIDSFF